MDVLYDRIHLHLLLEGPRDEVNQPLDNGPRSNRVRFAPCRATRTRTRVTCPVVVNSRRRTVSRPNDV